MLFRINVSIKKRKTHRWGEILCFIYVFVIMHLCMLQKMCNRAPWGPTFQWVAEFGVTPAENRITRYPLVTEPPLQLGGTLDLPEAPSRMIHRGEECVFSHPRGRILPTVREKRFVADVAAQTSATALWGPFERAMLFSSAGNIQLHDTTNQQHTSYVRGSIEVTEVNILVVSGATESFVSADFRMSVPALLKRPLKVVSAILVTLTSVVRFQTNRAS